jgi:HEAT repeat protein
MTAPERGTATLSPELARRVGHVARALVAAGRSWTLYPPEHPAVKTSVDRLTAAIREASAGQALSFSVSPDALLIEGIPVTTREGPTTEAAAWLHNRDVLQLSFLGDVPPPALHRLLALLSDDSEAVRGAGGPARVWAERGHAAIAVEQIDYAKVFQDRDVERPARKKDDLWRAIVRAVLDRRKTLDDAMQRRLLDIAGDIGAIGELAHDVMTPHHSADGSPMVTTQAAAVVAAYRHLASIVEVMAPERRTEVMQNLAAATSSMDPRIVIEMLRTPDEPAVAAAATTAPVREGLAGAFDDMRVANLLATTLAIEGQASARLAEVFGTIAPDESRKRRVLTLARELLSETSFGQTDQFRTLWSSMEELLLSYNERPFVGGEYKARLDALGVRAEQMAREVAPELAGLIDTLEQENVRKLSVILLIDLLRIERDPRRAPEVARDVGALAEDLLLSGEYRMALDVTAALAEQAGNPASVSHQGARATLDLLAGTAAFRETAELFGEMEDDAAAQFSQTCRQVGPAAVDALRELFRSETETAAMRRARPVIREFGTRSVSRLAPLVSSDQWFVQRNVAELLGELAASEAVPLLQPLLRGTDPRVLRATVRALANIDDPAAARAIHTVLRAATGEHRLAVVAALVEERDQRAVPLLGRILAESDPIGSDHTIVLETLDAIGQVGGDQAIPQVSTVMRRRGWFARRKLRAVKQASVAALLKIGSPAAQRALADAAADGDRLLKKLARAALPGAAPRG